jgi:hypothetical protein
MIAISLKAESPREKLIILQSLLKMLYFFLEQDYPYNSRMVLSVGIFSWIKVYVRVMNDNIELVV